MSTELKRPALRYHGGKWVLAPWIISHFPEHRIYVEPFAGAASVMLRKDISYAEVYNDLDGEVVNVFKQLRDNGAALKSLLELTPFSREEYAESTTPSEDPLEQARRTIIKSFMGFGSDSIKGKSGFRSNSNRSGTTPAHDWRNYADVLDVLIQRLRGVVIECRDYRRIVEQHDGPKTLFYVDPPYLHSTRTHSKRYRHEMTNQEHEDLLRLLRDVKGSVVISGYDSELYQDLLGDWERFERPSYADGALKRTEVLWRKAGVA